MAVKDTLTRKTGPRLIIASAGVKARHKLAAAKLRRTGGREQVEVFFAFDDALSAVALIGLADRLSGRNVDLVVIPVVERGMDADPAVEWKRAHSVIDAARLAARDGITFTRADVIRPEATRYLAKWVSARQPHRTVTAFAVAAVRAIWVENIDPSQTEHFAALWDVTVGGTPPGPGTHRLAKNQGLMKKRGPYETPAAWVRGQWFFAHERLDRITETLDELGWVKKP